MHAGRSFEPPTKDELQIGKFWHLGDPCIYCGTPHDKFEIGDCPAFTGEIRPPKIGEWFVGANNRINLALFDFTEISYRILHANIVREMLRKQMEAAIREGE